MNARETDVFSVALALPPSVRAELAELLWASLPDDTTEAPLDDRVRAAWLAEADRRMQQVATGQVRLIPGDEVMARVRGG